VTPAWKDENVYLRKILNNLFLFAIFKNSLDFAKIIAMLLITRSNQHNYNSFLTFKHCYIPLPEPTSDTIEKNKF
jgi:hypothetical protein